MPESCTCSSIDRVFHTSHRCTIPNLLHFRLIGTVVKTTFVSSVFLMVAATLAASCAFMLPVATPPNAVVFGSGYLKIVDMMKTGFWLNILSILIISLIIYFALPFIWDFDPYTIPKIFK